MLDIRFIRENADLVQEKSKQKGYDVDVPQLLVLDRQRRELLSQIEEYQHKRKALVSKLSAKPAEETLKEGRELKDKQFEVEKTFIATDKEMLKLWKAVPNMPADDVPPGTSETDNKDIKHWPEDDQKPHFDFKPKTHWEIGESRGWIDKERAAKVAGSRFAYLKGDLVRLQFAIVQFVMDTLTNEETLKIIAKNAGLDAGSKKVSSKPFVPVLPPLMIKTEVFEEMDRLEPRDERYKVGSDKDDLWLQGSAEHTLGPMHKDEILDLADLPIRYLGYATSFRREAGTYGKDTEGIIRMHQFDKLEMESFVNQEGGMLEHLFFVAIQEYLMQQLKIPYRVLQKCTADIGKPNARGIDLEAWLPGAGVYKETHTADYMTDYQARRLQTREKVGEVVRFVHTNDATAFALGRTMVAIIENYQTAEGKVKIPEALQKYMSGQAEI